jgi:hypothetical protein
VCGYGYLFYQNNRDILPVDNDRIARSYAHSVEWLLNHRAEILQNGNQMLWWMIGESARISGDARVQELFDEFRNDYDRSAPYDTWQAFFHPRQFRNAKFSSSEYMSLVEYQQYFLYALTCSSQLSEEPAIAAQNDPEFCWSGYRLIRPACVTHQLMGYRMAKRNNCDIENLDTKISTLQTTITRQLTYDPRVVDVYVQRVLMLIDSGAKDRVKPRWLERIMNTQQNDGGWSDMQPLIAIGGEKYIGFGANGFTIERPKSNFHATAQGMLLMSFLLHPEQ